MSANGTSATCSVSVSWSEIPSKADLRSMREKTGNIEVA